MIEPALKLVARALAPLPVIQAEQNGQRPPKPYATLKLVQSDNAGHPSQGLVDALGDITVTEHRMARLEVNVFGPGAHRIAAGLLLRLRLPSMISMADELNVGLADIGRAMNIPALVAASQYEERGMVEFGLYLIAAERDRVGIIEHVVLQDQTPEPTPPRVVSSATATTPPPVI